MAQVGSQPGGSLPAGGATLRSRGRGRNVSIKSSASWVGKKAKKAFGAVAQAVRRVGAYLSPSASNSSEAVAPVGMSGQGSRPTVSNPGSSGPQSSTFGLGAPREQTRRGGLLPLFAGSRSGVGGIGASPLMKVKDSGPSVLQVLNLLEVIEKKDDEAAKDLITGWYKNQGPEWEEWGENAGSLEVLRAIYTWSYDFSSMSPEHQELYTNFLDVFSEALGEYLTGQLSAATRDNSQDEQSSSKFYKKVQKCYDEAAKKGFYPHLILFQAKHLTNKLYFLSSLYSLSQSLLGCQEIKQEKVGKGNQFTIEIYNSNGQLEK